MIIHKITDRIKVKIGEITFHLSPLSWDQKQDIVSDAKLVEGKPTNRNSTYKCLKYAVKNIEGVTLADGSPYVVQLENNVLSDECVEDLLNLELSNKLIIACYSMVQGVPSKIINPVTGQILEGVEIVHKESKKKAE
jgi:hypothetical protein